MPAQIIDGKALAEKIMLDVRKDIVENAIHASLAVFLVGDDKPSELYVKLKEKACKKCGIDFNKYLIEPESSEEELITAIEFLNKEDSTDAILVQLPLPEGFDENKVIQAIDPKKDVDGFHPETMQAFLEGKSDFMPGLAEGIIRLIESTEEKLAGKKAVIIANSDIFAKPVEKLLEDQQVQAESLRPDDKTLVEKTKQADIIVIAIGQPGFLQVDMIKVGSILIDVGTTKVGDTIEGDIAFAECAEIAGYITPVPGGVGPVTVAMLLENTVKLAKQK